MLHVHARYCFRLRFRCQKPEVVIVKTIDHERVVWILDMTINERLEEGLSLVLNRELMVKTCPIFINIKCINSVKICSTS